MRLKHRRLDTDPPDGYIRTHESDLWLAVIEQALLDLVRPGRTHDGAMLKGQALFWLTSPDDSSDRRAVCSLAGISPNWLSRLVASLTEQGENTDSPPGVPGCLLRRDRFQKRA